ncbi:MAG: phosphotransferase [Anaerolineae bacterium]|nr:phosphotransferase [Anaerolineae bacterium]
MADTPLRDILINARQEAARMNHHFIGVEHLVTGALELRGGIASTLLEQYGYKTDYVIDAIRRHSGKGSSQRLWAGMPNSPRCQMIMSIAHDLALEVGRPEITERELLRAVLEENDSIPVRVWRNLGIDLSRFSEDVVSYSATRVITQPYVRVDFAVDYDPAMGALTEEHLFVLRRMFHGYSQLRVERRLTGGHSGALLLAVTPAQADGIEDSPVVVKIDRAESIMDEARRYEQHVRTTLPPLTARLEDRPTAPETTELAGLKYTFVAGQDRAPISAASQGPERLGGWLRDALFPAFGRTWWMQRRPYRFQAWEEYDWLLPPTLILEPLPPETPIPDNAHQLRDPVRRNAFQGIEYGEVVVVTGFALYKVERELERVQFAAAGGGEAARRAHRIEVRGFDLEHTAIYRGETVDQFAGRVYGTRHEAMLNAVRALAPDFDPTARTIPVAPPDERLPNPLLAYDALLDRHVLGTISRIHGDLHLGNILLGPNGSPFLIDFAHTRDGHTLFDWANLEISLHAEMVMPNLGESWADARRALARASGLPPAPPVSPDAQLDKAFLPVIALRGIVAECLARPNDWTEYWLALLFSALRAVTWETMTPGARRFMFLLAAWCTRLLEMRQMSGANVTELSIDIDIDSDHTDLSSSR